MTPSEERELFAEIYAADLDPSRWQAVLARLSRIAGGIKTQMFGFDSAIANSLIDQTYVFNPGRLH